MFLAVFREMISPVKVWRGGEGSVSFFFREEKEKMGFIYEKQKPIGPPFSYKKMLVHPTFSIKNKNRSDHHFLIKNKHKRVGWASVCLKKQVSNQRFLYIAVLFFLTIFPFMLVF
jgi:hypothetical protein